VILTPLEGELSPENLQNAVLVVRDKREQVVEEEAPPPFTTATLLEETVQMPGWSAGKVMQAAQFLFENGLITYPRTDAVHLAPEALDELRRVAALLHGQSALARQVEEIAPTGAHEAIRPTSAARLPEELDYLEADARTLYALIWRRSLAACLKPARYRRVTVDFALEP
jgi:DNA topoisomerase I